MNKHLAKEAVRLVRWVADGKFKSLKTVEAAARSLLQPYSEQEIAGEVVFAPAEEASTSGPDRGSGR